jgi:hypothetical protein
MLVPHGSVQVSADEDAKREMAQTAASYVSRQGLAGGLLLVLGAALSLAAAIFHWFYIEEHTLEWWGYGLFFAVVAAAQALYAGSLILWPRRWLYWVGIVGNVALIALYIVTRTHGVPMGPDTGMIEEMQPPDLIETVTEALLVLCLAALVLLPVIGGSAESPRGGIDESPTEPARDPEDETRMVEAH